MQHQNYLENVTKKFRSSRERPDLCMHVPYTDERDAMKRIRACMKNGIPLAFDDFPRLLKPLSDVDFVQPLVTKFR